VVSPPAVRLGDFAAVIVSQLAAQEAAQIVAGVSEGRRERCGGPIDAVLTPEGLTWGGRTYPWRVVGGLRGYTANTWNQGKVDLLSPNGGPPLGSFYLGAGMSSDTVGACMAVDMLAHGAR
jgi:hypothetical protein